MISDQQTGYIVMISFGCYMKRCLSELIVLVDKEFVVSEKVPNFTNQIAPCRTEKLCWTLTAVGICWNNISAVISRFNPVVLDISGNIK